MENQALADDLLRGAREIAAYLNEPRRRVLHMLATGQLPYTKVGTRIDSKKSALDRMFEVSESRSAK